MTDDRIPAIETLLAETEAAHGAYETTELNGVYDEQWPQWYAAYAVDHGIGAVLERDVTAGELGGILATAYQDFQATDPGPTDSWSTYVARRIVEG